MSTTLELLRPEISGLKPYKPADYVGGCIRLNANETPWRPPGDDSRDGLNRYPDPRPGELTARLAAHYGVAADALLVTRGSSEAIDLLVRGFCRAGQDEIVICPPTFGMYEFYAQVQGAGIRRIPLDRERGYALPLAEICAQWTACSKLVFVCSPNNPTGNCFSAVMSNNCAAASVAVAWWCSTVPMSSLLLPIRCTSCSLATTTSWCCAPCPSR